MEAPRTYDGLHIKLRGLESTFTQLVEQVATTLRKELQATAERLERRLETDSKEQAAELHKAKCGMTLQSSEDVKAAEDRLIRRLDAERRDAKEMLSELRREVNSQLVAREKQDTASFATQRVVPKENDEAAALRKKIEEVAAVASNAQQDTLRLATDLAEQRRRIDCMDQAMNKHFSKHGDEMLALRASVEKVEMLAQQARKADAQGEQGLTVNLVTDVIADNLKEVETSMLAQTQGMVQQMVEQVQAELQNELRRKSLETQEELKQMKEKEKDPQDCEKRLKKLEDSRLDLRLGALESAAQRASHYSDAGESTLFSNVHSRRNSNTLGAKVEKVSLETPLRERTRLDQQLDDLISSTATMGQKTLKGDVHDFVEPLVSTDLKNRLESLVEQVKGALSSAQFPSLTAPNDYENAPDGHNEALDYAPYEAQYEDPGYDYIPNGQPEHFAEQFAYDVAPEQVYGYDQMGQMYPQAPMIQTPMTPQAPVHVPMQHMPMPLAQPGQPLPPMSHAQCCGSIALPITREPEYYREREHAASEYGVHLPNDYGLMGSLDGEGCAGGGGYEMLDAPGYIDVPQVPIAGVSYGAQRVVGVGQPVLHSVTRRPMSPLREQSPIRGRGASPVRGASPLRTPAQPRYRDVSPTRARSIGDPSFSFQQGLMMSPVPVSVVTQGAAVQRAQLPQATVKEDPPKEDEESDDSDDEKPGLFGRMFGGK